MNQKEIIRNKIMYVRDNLSKEEKEKYDSIILKKLINSDIFKNSKIIFTYVSMQNEINTIDLIQNCFKNNKVVCVPKVNPKEKVMNAYQIKSLSELTEGHFGVLEPKEGNRIEPYKIDLAIFPGLAFDKEGYRIGYGGGYYDKYFSQNNITARKIALAYEFQIMNDIPSEKHDIAVNCIITN
ncbi:5-formyltetrahydrofolate cyclo-ligase [Clostridium sp. DL1XJH146]